MRLFLLSAPIFLFMLAACRASPAEFNFQYACLHGSLPTCLAAEDFADRVAERTDGRVRINISSIAGERVSVFKVIPRLEDGTLDIVEIYSAHISRGSDRATLEILDIWGLYADYESQDQVAQAISQEIEWIIAEQTGGVVLGVQFYPSNYIFARGPVLTKADFLGLKARSINTLSDDLLIGMGATLKSPPFSSIYSNFYTNALDAAISCSSCGVGLRWFEVTNHLVGPIPALGYSWLTINGDMWSELPPDIQLIMREEAKRHETVTKESSLSVWDSRGVEQNVSEGLELVELTPELKELMRIATLTTVLPNWVKRAGGPSSNAVKVFNEIAAPLVNVKIAADGTAKEIK